MTAAPSREDPRPAPKRDTIVAIEVPFAVPVEPTREQAQRLAELIDEIARANAPDGCVHWLSGIGSKPNFSQADARFLGKTVDPDAPESGEPTFDDSILCMETYCREK
jgi:hypothetical protein